MSIKKDGIMVVLSSPSGAGKTTLVKLLSKKKNLIFPYHTQLESLELMRSQTKTIIL